MMAEALPWTRRRPTFGRGEDPPTEFRGVAEFDLSSIPSGSTIDTATLLLDAVMPPVPTVSNFTAFVDFNDFDGASAAVPNTNIVGDNSSAVLVDFATGDATGVTLTVPAFTFGDFNVTNVHPLGGDALSIFGPVGTTVSGDGMLDDFPTNDVTITIDGLDVTTRYDLVIYNGRADGVGARTNTLTLGGADSFVNTSSAGATISTVNQTNDTATITIDDNVTAGNVFRWSEIDAGADGVITVHMTAGGASPDVQTNIMRLQGMGGPTVSIDVEVEADFGNGIVDPSDAESTFFFPNLFHWQFDQGTLTADPDISLDVTNTVQTLFDAGANFVRFTVAEDAPPIGDTNAFVTAYAGSPASLPGTTGPVPAL